MLDDNVLSKIRPESLTSYLTGAGWNNETPEGADVFKYTHPEGGALILPTTSQVPRYAKVVTNVISTLSGWEDRSSIDIFQSIVSPNADSLSFAFKGQLSDRGSLPLGYMHSAIGNLRNTIAYSACSEWQPKPYYKRKTAQAIEMADKTRFGQTQMGSFVINVSLSHSRSTPNSEPIERKVFKRIIHGLNQARNSVVAGTVIDYAEDYKTGLNSNLAESLSQLNSEGIALQITPQWDSNIPIDDDFKRTLTIEERIFEALDGISVGYRGDEVSKPVSITKAKVISLTWDAGEDLDEDSSDSGDAPNAILKIIAPEKFPVSKVRVSLEPDDYRKACKAHMDGKEISLNGELSKYKNRWWILKYESLEILGS